MIPVYQPLFMGNEKKYVCEAIDKGEVSGQGSFVRRFEEAFAKWAGTKYAVAVCNGTAALETAFWSAGVSNIRIPDSTIISCVLAAIRTGVDYDLYGNSLGRSNVFLDKDILRCHLFGHFDNSFSHKGINIDDASQYWEPFRVRDVACYSLYANKLITSGEGGVLITNKKSIYERAKSYRNLCHSKERFIHNDLGFNFRMSNIQAAVALAQLEQIDRVIGIKQKNGDLYKKYLSDDVGILFDVNVPWMYLVSTSQNAGKITKRLLRKGIETRRFFYPLHRQPCLQYNHKDKHFLNCDFAWEDYFYLPSGLTLTEKEIKYICRTLKNTLNTTT